jgi:hypothetical protein
LSWDGFFFPHNNEAMQAKIFLLGKEKMKSDFEKIPDEERSISYHTWKSTSNQSIDSKKQSYE